jgi:RHS repeat-associated protein
MDYTFAADNRIAGGGGLTFAHDANGNLTGISGTPSTTLGYDALDRLTSVQRGADLIEYAYDPLGQRVSRTVNGLTERWVVDPSAYFSRVLMETDAEGNPLAYYVHGMGLIAMITPTGETYTYHYDWRGSTVALTDGSGAVVNRYGYDAWGNPGTNSFEQVANPFRFVGRLGVMDEGNGLLYMRARYYLPALGRFTSKDPVGTLGGPNFYAYARNDPVGLMDPLGLWYVDAGVSFGFGNGLGVVGGVFMGPDGFHPYAGGGYVTAGPGASVMWSPGSPSPGCWSSSVAAGSVLGGSVGYGGGGPFWEVGLTFPGASWVDYYTW